MTRGTWMIVALMLASMSGVWLLTALHLAELSMPAAAMCLVLYLTHLAGSLYCGSLAVKP